MQKNAIICKAASYLYTLKKRPDLTEYVPRLNFRVKEKVFSIGGRMKNTVKVERAIKNITQQELAEAVGVSRQTINFIETGRYMPSTIVALKIAKYFGRHADEIFQLEENN